MKTPFDAWLKPNTNTPFPSPNAFIDMKDLMESGRKSVQAYAEAQQVAAESMQTIMQRQSEILSQMVKDNSSIAQEIINEGTPEEKIARGAELIRSAYERTISSMQEVGDICSKSNKEACDIINRRVADCIEEIGVSARDAAAQKTKPKAKKSA